MLYYYLKTVASIFFSDSILAGSIIVVALLFLSRIKSTVAFLGFVFAFVTSKMMGVDIQLLTQNLAGVNYLFWGMAIGCFFLIPNTYSYLLVIGLTPALFLINSGIESLIGSLGLSSYTLSFSLLSILLLFILGQRSKNRFFVFPYIQYYNPEKMNFGVLRVLNDDKVAPGMGFPTGRSVDRRRWPRAGFRAQRASYLPSW